jgi:hypothetical protein
MKVVPNSLFYLWDIFLDFYNLFSYFILSQGLKSGFNLNPGISWRGVHLSASYTLRAWARLPGIISHLEHMQGIMASATFATYPARSVQTPSPLTPHGPAFPHPLSARQTACAPPSLESSAATSPRAAAAPECRHPKLDAASPCQFHRRKLQSLGPS